MPSSTAPATTASALARLPDEFDAYARVFKENGRYRLRECIYLALLVLFALALVIVSMQPPVVIVKDSTTSAPPVVVSTGVAPPIRELDAANFFLYVLRKRYGWESPTVVRDFEELHSLMTEEMRTAFVTYVNQPVPATPRPSDPPASGDAPKLARVADWVRALVRNDVILPRDKIECRAGEAVAGVEQWYCRGFGVIETTPLAGGLAEATTVRRRVEFRARFQPAPYSATRLWGLGVAYVDALNEEE